MHVYGDNRLDRYDITGIVLYFCLVVAVGVLSMCRSKRHTVSGYFLANKESSWYMIGASVFASNIGTEHFIGLAGSGAAVGSCSSPAFSLGLPACLHRQQGLHAAGVHEEALWRIKDQDIPRLHVAHAVHLHKNIGGALCRNTVCRSELAMESMAGNFAPSRNDGCIVHDWRAMYTEVLQAISSLLGAGLIFVLAFIKIGGYKYLLRQYPLASSNVTYSVDGKECNLPLPDAFVMLREPADPNLPWVGFLLGQTTVSIWYWAADQMMVQRMLSAKSLSHAKGGALVAGYFKFAFLFVMIIPGMIGRVLWPDEVACANPDVCEEVCGNRRGCTDIVYPKLVMELLPSGLRGLMLAVMLSSLVSDLLSIFNSASALFTIDIWSKIRKNAQAREILIVGRLFNVILLAISVLWVPLIQQVQGGQMFFYIKAIGAYLGPPIGAIFVLALFWKRCNESGAFYGLMVGLVVGLIRMGLDFTFRSPECGMPDERPAITRDVHYMYFAFILFTVTIVAAVVVSLTTPPSDVEKLVRTTFTTRFDETRRPDDFRYDRRPSRALSGVPPIEEFGCLETDDVTGSNGLKTDPLDEHEEERGSGFLLRSRTKLVDFCFGNAAPTQDEKDAHDAHLAKVSSLDQSPGAKLFLNINLGLLLILVIFVFILFSQ